MELVFDISQDELPLFLAETDEHLQLLDEGLVKLERKDEDPDLLQTLFRAAHTLKGIAGMIGHKRMVELTHKVEAAFDAVRKNELNISTSLIDLCLEGVDGLRLLRDEVLSGETSQVNVEMMVNNFGVFLESSITPGRRSNGNGAHGHQPTTGSTGVSTDSIPKYTIQADIASISIASAARAFQLMLVLQDMGEVLSMQPSQEIIETAAPVKHFTALLKSGKPAADIQRSLSMISEIDRLVVLRIVEEESVSNQAPDPTVEVDRLGDFMVKNGYINQNQLEAALLEQKQQKGDTPRLGHILIDNGSISQEKMDHVLAELIETQRTALQTIQAPSAEKIAREKSADKMVRTSVERLDNLMNLVGELITDRNRLIQTRNSLDMRFRGDEQVSTLVDTVTHIGLITDQLQEEVMRIRMLPVSNVFSKFPRLVRDLAQKCGKEIELVVRGEDTELNRSVIEEINDPLIHLLRNSVDHGIEEPHDRLAAGKPSCGKILLTARHEQGRIVLTTEDDGKGIDLNRLKGAAVKKGLITEVEAAVMPDEKAIDLIFQSGISTSRLVTDVSGRGVGMDIVRANIERINGSILVESWPGRGTQFQIILPLTLAIVPTLLVRVGENTIAIPLAAVTETRRVTSNEIQTVRNRPVIMLRNKVLTLLGLADLYGLENKSEIGEHQYVVVVTSGKTQIGLMVDTLIGEEEVVVKSMGALIGDVPGVSSAAILGDGQVALIADVQSMYKLAGIH